MLSVAEVARIQKYLDPHDVIKVETETAMDVVKAGASEGLPETSAKSSGASTSPAICTTVTTEMALGMDSAGTTAATSAPRAEPSRRRATWCRREGGRPWRALGVRWGVARPPAALCPARPDEAARLVPGRSDEDVPGA